MHGAGRKNRNFFFTSHFVSKLLNKDHATLDGYYGFENVEGWARRALPDKLDLFDLDNLYIPVNVHDIYWILAVVSFSNRTIKILDSMSGNHQQLANHLFRYIN